MTDPDAEFTMPLTLTHTSGVEVALSSGGRPLFTYRYSPDDAQFESPRPYVHPVHTLGGRLVSLFRPHDHVWHKGIAFSLPNVGDDNFWGGATYRNGIGYRQFPNNGAMVHRTVTHSAVDAEGARFSHELDWIAEGGERIISESRRLSAHIVSRDAWVLTWQTTLCNESGRMIPIGSPTTEGRDNAGYGGLFWRGPRSFTDGALISPDGIGGDELRGTRHEWMGLVGRHDGTDGESTVIMVDGRDNLQHPPQWFARSQMFGCLNPAPFFSDVFHFGPETLLTLSYAVVIADGGSTLERAHDLAHLGRARLPIVEGALV